MLSNEVDMYIELKERAFDDIVRYYGSFVQQGKFTLILEFASEGNLLDYFEHTPHPPTGFERVRFWLRFFLLLHALTYIHQLCKFKGNVLKGLVQSGRQLRDLLADFCAVVFIRIFVPRTFLCSLGQRAARPTSVSSLLISELVMSESVVMGG